MNPEAVRHAWHNHTLGDIPGDDNAPADACNLPGGKAAARHFRMGITGFRHDFSIEAVVSAREFFRQNADLIAHHIEGVPWAELLAGKPFSDDLINEGKGKKEATPEGGKVYLAI